MAVLRQIKEMILIIEHTKRKEIGHSKQEFPIMAHIFGHGMIGIMTLLMRLIRVLCSLKVAPIILMFQLI